VRFAKRATGAELLNHVERGDVVIVAAIDRAFSSASDAQATLMSLREKGVALHVCGIGNVSEGDLGTAFGETVRQFAELEHERVRERLLMAHERHRAAGRHFSGPVAFGYVRRDDGLLEEDPEKQEALSFMRRLRFEDKSFRFIQAALKERFGISLSPWGIQRIVEQRRQTDDEMIRRRRPRFASHEAESVRAVEAKTTEKSTASGKLRFNKISVKEGEVKPNK